MRHNHNHHSTRSVASRASFALCLLLGALLLQPFRADASNVLLLWDDDAENVENTPPLVEELNAGTQALIGALVEAGLTVTLSNRPQHEYRGSQPGPTLFDVVIHLNGNTTSTLNVMRSSTVVKLLNYVQNDGGGIVTNENTEAQIEIPFVGMNRAMEALMLLDRVDGPPPPIGNITLIKIPTQINHPVLRGLQNQFSFTGTRMNSVLRVYDSDPATAILVDGAGATAGAVRDFGAGRVVSFHHAGNFESLGTYSDTLKDPDVQRLYVNAARWADQRPPNLVSLVRASATPTNASNVRYTATFNESVDGVNATDFRVNLAGGFNILPQVSVDELSPTVYEVRLSGLSGTGSVSLTLLNDGSIHDRSFNENVLTGEEVTGPTYFVDALKPIVQSFSSDVNVVPEGGKAKLTFGFSEPMQTSVFPVVTVATADNGSILASPAGSVDPNAPERVESGLLALYNFDESNGVTVKDSSGNGTPLDLTIQNSDAVSWGAGYLSVNFPTIIDSDGPAIKLYEGVTATGEMTMEAWVRPVSLVQTGPARMMTYSVHTGSRNATLGQEADSYVTRVRTNTTSVNGTPESTSDGGVVVGALQHVVYTRGANGTTRFYIDGELVNEGNVSGEINLSTWDSTFAFALANEFTLSRPWTGEYHLAAMYNRVLSGAEVDQNFDAGASEGGFGDGRWNGAFTYEVSFDRNVIQEDEGTAVIRISGAKDVPGNTMNADANNAIGIIEGGLIITQQLPVSTLVEAGDTHTFRVVVAGGIGPINYEWFHETGTKALVPVGGNSASLVLEDLELADAGNYYCVITDDASVLQTAPGYLQVVPSLQAASNYTIFTLAGSLFLLASLVLLIGLVEHKDD